MRLWDGEEGRGIMWGEESNREWQEKRLPVMKYKQWRFIAPISLEGRNRAPGEAGV